MYIFFLTTSATLSIPDEVELIDRRARISAFDCSEPSDLSVHRYGKDFECALDNGTLDESPKEVVHFQVLQKYRKVETRGVKCIVIKSMKNFLWTFYSSDFSHGFGPSTP